LAIFRFLGEGKRKDAWAVSRAHQNFVASLFKSRKVRKSGSPEVESPGLEAGSLQTANLKLPTKRYPLKGIYKGSLVWAFFIKKKRHFTELDPADFF